MRIRSRFPRKVEVIEHSLITLADGCRLAAKIWLPEDAEADPVPAILEYLPYRKRDGTTRRDALTHPYLAGHGYACVRVDMRGSGDSEGVLLDEYSQQELDDGCEIIAWLAKQAWCSGAVGMMGISWGGFNGLQIAALRPPALKAIITLCSTDDRYADDVHYMGGCLLNENLTWASVMFAILSQPPDPALVGERWRELWLQRLEQGVLPIEPWLRHQRRDAYWKHGSVCEDYAAIECPVYAIGGWEDGYSNAVFRLLANLEAPCKGLIGPWAHAYPHFAMPGPQIGFLDEALRWWDQWLKGKETGIMDEPRLRAWMQDSAPPATHRKTRPGRWVAEAAWPSPRILRQPYALNPGWLDAKPAVERALQHLSPQTLGSAWGEWCSYGAAPDLSGDQREDDGQSLCFDSAPLVRRMEILGQPVAELELAVDRPLANIAVRLNDVMPDGRSTRVTYGVLNLTHCDGHETPQPLEPGKRYRVRVALNDAGHAFARGHRLRLALSTAYWPLLWPAPEPVTLTLYSGASRLLLPVRPRTAESQAEDRKLRPFPPAAGAPPESRTRLSGGHYSRRLERDLASGASTVVADVDNGRERLDAHGLESASRYEQRFSVAPNDPLSARSEKAYWITLARDGWQVRSETRTVLTATAQDFLVTASLETFEGEQRVFARTWNLKIPRDGV